MNDIQQAVDEFRNHHPSAEFHAAEQFGRDRFGGDQNKLGEFLSLWQRFKQTDAEFKFMREGSAGEKGR